MDDSKSSDREMGELVGKVEALIDNSREQFKRLFTEVGNLAEKFSVYTVEHDKRDDVKLSDFDKRIKVLEDEKLVRNQKGNSLVSKLWTQFLHTVSSVIATAAVAFFAWLLFQFATKGLSV